MFGEDLAEVYDMVYRARGQDFDKEAALVTEIVRSRRPDARSLLDVGCGTGEHLVAFARSFPSVTGIDLAAPMLAVAERKLPPGTVRRADMRDVDLGRTYDAVVSLSTAVAYLPSLADFRAALARMVAHLAPAGVLVIEPWYFPENYLDGYVAGDLIRHDGYTVSRVSHSREQDGVTVIESHWAVANRDGIRHFTETHLFQLWTREQYASEFAHAGLAAEYLSGVQAGRGLFVAHRRGEHAAAGPVGHAAGRADAGTGERR
ncbi:class I SAM-dependent methyltransferase [Micromonospora sp. WMMD882]|uniref:class I SAM-dependent methyltransferase n=1 Tax=Micromonospora sp. WMMD882 TaxID=3015151 RepID=UPI00248D399A|nr:class I SAM-dependent methyltransferase [Micromonospora sp. WMMD882]WBB78710.1 class I SAM-dependent methyltransferase [Micromonospora sp. WMMD882]